MSTIRVGNGFMKKNLGEAIGSSKPGDVLLVDPGSYSYPAGLSVQTLTLRGAGDPGSVMIESTFTAHQSLSLSNLTLRAAAFATAVTVKAGAKVELDHVDVIPDPTNKKVGVWVDGGTLEMRDSRVLGEHVTRSDSVPLPVAIRAQNGATVRMTGVECTDCAVWLETSTAAVSHVSVGQFRIQQRSRVISRDTVEVGNTGGQREIALRDESTGEFNRVSAPDGGAEAHVADSFLRLASYTEGRPAALASLPVFTRGSSAVDAAPGAAHVTDLDRREAEPARPKTVTWPAGEPWESIQPQLNLQDTLVLEEGEYTIPDPTTMCDVLGKGGAQRIRLTAPQVIFNDGKQHSLSNLTLVAGSRDDNVLKILDGTEVRLSSVFVDHTETSGEMYAAWVQGSRLVADRCRMTGRGESWSFSVGVEGGEFVAAASELEALTVRDDGSLELSRCEVGLLQAQTGTRVVCPDELDVVPVSDSVCAVEVHENASVDVARMVSSSDDLALYARSGTLRIREVDAAAESVRVAQDESAEVDVPASVSRFDLDWNPLAVRATSAAVPERAVPAEGGDGDPMVRESAEGPEAGGDRAGAESDADPMAQIDALTGLETVKKQIRRFLRTVEFNREREAHGHRGVDMTMHSLFLGSPGTGKTTVARLLGKALFQAGAIPSEVFVEASQEDLVSPNIGETPQKTRAVLESALGGVLFIDEAYSLYQESGGGGYGPQAVDTILKFMEDHRRDIMVIFAGYTDKMQDFLGMNPGLRSRITNTFEFEDYTPDEIAQIGLAMLADEGWEVDADLYSSIVGRKYARSSDHSNGRWIRNQNQELLGVVIDRYMEKGGDTSTILDEDLYTFSGGDADSNEQQVNELLARLDGMIGLAPVKDFVRDLVLQVQADQQLARAGRVTGQPTYHMVFEGNPGTGKTTVAEIVARLFHALGILENGNVKTVERRDLVGSYIGHTEKQTGRAIDEAMGGVLFVDEAYQLVVEESPNDFGKQAVETLLTALENQRASFVAIFAGYTEQMEHFLGQNPGLRSRVPHRIVFPDYTPDEVATIVCARLASSWTFNEDLVHEVAAERYAALPEQDRSNGRWARTFSEGLELAHKKWIVQSSAGADITRIQDDVVESFRSPA